jgi:hypothetical protein
VKETLSAKGNNPEQAVIAGAGLFPFSFVQHGAAFSVRPFYLSLYQQKQA